MAGMSSFKRWRNVVMTSYSTNRLRLTGIEAIGSSDQMNDVTAQTKTSAPLEDARFTRYSLATTHQYSVG
jgi:hypothetical protein